MVARSAVLAFALLAVAAHAQWSVLHHGFTTILIGVECADNSTCYMAGGVNGGPDGGPQVWRTDDFGQSFNMVPHSPAMMFLDVATQSKSNAVISGPGMFGIFPGSLYTLDGKVFNGSKNVDLVSASQSVNRIVGTRAGFGMAGEFTTMDTNAAINGVSISMDGGVNFKHFDVNMNASARYVAFPSPNVWYVTAGSWPSYTQKPGSRQLTSRISVDYDEFAAVEGSAPAMKARLDLSGATQASPAPNSGYKAAIATTKDGGRTWKQVFWAEDFYFNEISCPTETKCWAVGESSNGAHPGARIWHTANGGQTWEEQLYAPIASYSLVAISMVDEREGWAAGGNMAQDFYSVIYHTVDGGKTWTQETPITGYYPNSIALSPKYPSGGYRALATAFNRDGDSSVLAYN